jgi:hypothetical protein
MVSFHCTCQGWKGLNADFSFVPVLPRIELKIFDGGSLYSFHRIFKKDLKQRLARYDDIMELGNKLSKIYF